MQCVPSYIRCIKPNETKRPLDWDAKRVDHQCRYLNLRENINVRRAGFCSRQTYEKFLKRYAIVCAQTYPRWNGQPVEGVKLLLTTAGLNSDQWQLGKTKVFIKQPESLWMLEEARERKFQGYARIIQKAYRKYAAERVYIEARKKGMWLLVCFPAYAQHVRTQHSLLFTGRRNVGN